MTRPEATIENRFVKYAKEQGCLAIKLRIDGRNGWPDRTVITPAGRTMFVEFKTATGRLSAAQREWIVELQSMGYDVTVATSFKQAKDALDLFLTE